MIYFDDVLVFLLFVLVQWCSLRMDEDTVEIVTNNYNKDKIYFITKSWSTDFFFSIYSFINPNDNGKPIDLVNCGLPHCSERTSKLIWLVFFRHPYEK